MLRPRRPTRHGESGTALGNHVGGNNPTDLVQRVWPGQQEHTERSKRLMVLPMTACSSAAHAAVVSGVPAR